MKIQVKAGLIFSLALLMPLTGCVREELPPVQAAAVTTAIPEITETRMHESITQTINVTMPVSETITESATAVQTAVPTETFTESVQQEESISPNDSFKIKTSSTDYIDIAEEVLANVYSKSEKNNEFEINDIRYMAKGMVENHLWFAVKFTVQTDTETSRLEALIQRDRNQEYSLITINAKVPIDNLTDEENSPPPDNAYLAEFLTPLQGTNVLTSDWNINDGILPSSNDLVVFAQKLIGEKATYTVDEIYAEVKKYLDVSPDYIKSSGYYNSTTDCFSLIENRNVWNYAFVSAVTDGSVHHLKLMGIKADSGHFSKEILLTINGNAEQFRLISCAVNEREIPQPEIPRVLSHNEILLGEKVVSVDLVLNNGRYIESVNDKNIFSCGYRGKYELVISDGETELCRYEVSFPETEFLNFREPFKIAFSDYDKDGNFEFSLGQWRNGRMYYQFYTIDESGNINFLPINGEAVITDDALYSKEFRHTSDSFSVDIYSAEENCFHTVNYAVSPENITSVTEEKQPVS